MNDAAIAERAPGFDGLERVFALIPFEQGGQVSWARRDFQYGGSWSYHDPGPGSGISNPTYDMHTLYLGAGKFDALAAVKYGIAFGIETNVETLWDQTPDDNRKPWDS